MIPAERIEDALALLDAAHAQLNHVPSFPKSLLRELDRIIEFTEQIQAFLDPEEMAS